MQTINVHEAQERLVSLLDAVASGEEVMILRHGKPAARLTSALSKTVAFPDRSELRASIPPENDSAVEAIRAERDEERY
jgi:prevent-host-death family protein|tara:strand:- start:828 stop:1064 length:237 start_codon:yes stop_codon:yes gene_type:complete